jgi:DNA-binding XRE family transcriptional regulator
MQKSARGVGPAGLLKKRTSWLDPKVVFVTKDDALEAAAMALWSISKKIRARQGELGLTDLALAEKTGIQRQTLAALTMGTSWPDARTLGRICFVLGLELMTSVKDAE